MEIIHIFSSVQGVQVSQFDHHSGTRMISPIEFSVIKSKIMAVTEWLAKYFYSQRVRVNCISLGVILDSQALEFLKEYRKACTNIEMLYPSHVVTSAVFLLSQSLTTINGENLIIDDGWTL